VFHQKKQQNKKLWKVQPIIDSVRKSACPFWCHIIYQLIPFYGTTTLKQYIKDSNPVGIKNFVLATSYGMLPDFFIYQSAKTWPDG
jgi:uncharacterized membrane protein YdjX (TVP38/TMEM64 family)